jgi:hypothetical protein
MRLSNFLTFTFFIFLYLISGESVASSWERIQPEASMVITHSDGSEETISPSCAMKSLNTPIGELANDFAFYFQKGESDNLLIYFNGGGACWDDATCLASLQLAYDDSPYTKPAFNPSMYEENSPTTSGGIFADAEENPFKNWSKIFIPYCTGDLHIGTKDIQYSDRTGFVSGIPSTPITIHHRGYDNVMSVREWLKEKLNSKAITPKNILMSGSSAGGYGATFNFPYFQEITEKKVKLFADSSVGVISKGFVEDLLGYGGNWGIENTLADQFKPLLGRFNSLYMNKQVFMTLAYQYPRNRFAQYTTGSDVVQMQFFKISDQVDKGNTDPYSWELSETDFRYIFPWQIIMNSSVHFLSTFTWNYQFYVGEGTCHIILTDFCEQNAFPVSSPSPFYNEQSAKNIVFRDWLYDFATQRRFREKSVAYYH